MQLAKLLLIFATLFCTNRADNAPDIPIVGSILGTITDASKGVVNGVIDTIETVEHTAYGIIDNVKENFLKLIEDFRARMQEGIVEIGLPRLEPLEIDHIDFDINHEIGIFKGFVHNAKVEGLSKFKVKDLNIIIAQFRVILNVTFDELDVSGHYKVDGVFGDLVQVYGEGPFTAVLRDISTGVDVKIGFANKAAVVRSLHLTFSMKNMTCEFRNLMGGGENEVLFNTVIGKLAPEAVDSLWPEIEPLVAEKVKEEANERLKTIPLDKILGIFRPPKPFAE